MRVVLDPNVLISARLAPLGAPAGIVRAWTDDRFDLVVSPELLDELDDVLHRERFRRWLTPEDATAYVDQLRAGAIAIADPAQRPKATPDPDDDYLMALAETCGADYLVSGDGDLTGLEAPAVPVLTPKAFAELIRV